MADEDDDVVIGDHDQDEETLEAEAREYGWVPEEEYKGKGPWISAKDYVEKGRHVVPIMRANNKKLATDVLTLKNENGTLKTNLEQMRQQLQELQQGSHKQDQERVAQQRATLQARLDAAIEDQDFKLAFDLKDKLSQLKDPAAPKVSEDPKKQTSNQNHPIVQEFMDNNSWFGNPVNEDYDPKRTKEYSRILEDLVDDDPSLRGTKKLFSQALKELEKREGKKNNRDPDNKFESGNNAPAGGKGGKGYGALPAEAKAVCDDEEGSMVGKGRPFKTQAEWRSHYAKIYFEG